MYKLDNFKSCCDYLGIDNTLPVCQIDERQIQAAYKLRVCVKAWNKQDGFVPDEMANFHQGGVGYTPYFYLKGGRLLSAGNSYHDSDAWSVDAAAVIAASTAYANLVLRLPLKTHARAVDFGKTFIEIFNELI